MFCRCCLQNDISIDSNQQLLNMKSVSLINQNQKVSFLDAYSAVTKDQTIFHIPEAGICETCALFLESAYIFRQMCNDAKQPVPNVCICCLLEKIDDNFRFWNMRTDVFVHKNQRVTFFEGYCEINNCTIDEADLTQNIICEDCAIQLESAYVFQRMCREAIAVLQRRLSPESISIDQDECNVTVTHHSDINDRRPSVPQDYKRQHRAQYLIISYNCKKCPKVLKSKLGLSSHRRITHNDIHFNRILYVKVYKRRQAVPPPPLQKCEKFSKNQPTLRCRTKNLHKIGLFSCGKCSKVYLTELALQRHMCEEVVKATFACKHCEKIFKTVYSLSRHITAVHLIVEYPCKKCNKTYRKKTELYMHDRIEHQNILFTCQHCDKGYKTIYGLSWHIKMVHLKQKPKLHPCKNCPKQYTKKKRLFEHNQSVHLNDPFTCNDCDKVFITTRGLSTHIKYVHLNISYPCTNCTKVYPKKSSLRYHNFKKHLEKS
jgi:hypothetical protein